MSKMSELSQVLDELVACGEALIHTANTIREIFTEENAEGKSIAPPEVQTSAEPAPAEPKPLTKEAVRAVLAAKSSAGYKNEVKAILAKYGATQLKQLASENYEAVVAEASALGTETEDTANA